MSLQESSINPHIHPPTPLHPRPEAPVHARLTQISARHISSYVRILLRLSSFSNPERPANHPATKPIPYIVLHHKRRMRPRRGLCPPHASPYCSATPACLPITMCCCSQAIKTYRIGSTNTSGSFSWRHLLTDQEARTSAGVEAGACLGAL